jgi:predicted nucleotidyltransferase
VYHSFVPEDFEQFVAAHRERRERDQQLAAELALHARQAAQNVADSLVARFGVTRVLLMGSLARGAFTLRSDIDLAVEGLAPGLLVDALAVAEQGCPFPIDVVPLDAVRPEMAESIRREGIALWPR